MKDENKSKEQLIKGIEDLRRQITKLEASNSQNKRIEEIQRYLDIAEVIFVVIGVDQKVKSINHKGCEILGYDENEIIEKNWFDTFLPKKMRKDVKNVFKKLVTGEIEPVEYFENPVLTKDGREKIIKWHNTVFRDEDGCVTSTLSSGVDITEHKQTEDALRESEEKFRAILESASESIVLINQKGRIELVNAQTEKTFGYRKEELLGKKLEMLLPQRARNIHKKHRKDFFFNPRSRSMGIGLDLYGRNKDGREFPIEVSLSHVKTKNGILAMSLIIDITKRKQVEESLRESDKLAIVGQLTAGIAHEVGNPLTSIASLVQVLQRKTNEEFVKNKLDLIRGQIKRISKIIRELVDFSRPSSHDFQKTQVNKVALNAVEIVRYDKKAKHVEFELLLTEDLPYINVIPDHLFQVFINILINSVDAIKKSSGMIQLSSKLDRNLVVISFKDNGNGIPEAHIDKIFEPFFTTKEPGKGTGLGLWISYTIIKGFHGNIDVKSIEGQGSEFVISIPVAELKRNNSTIKT